MAIGTSPYPTRNTVAGVQPCVCLPDAGLQKSLRTATRHGLWGMGQMMFTKYIVAVDAGVNVHNTSEVLFHLTANTDPQRDSIFTQRPSDVLDHATGEIASGSKMGFDAREFLGEGFKRAVPPLIKMDEEVKNKINSPFGGSRRQALKKSLNFPCSNEKLRSTN